MSENLLSSTYEILCEIGSGGGGTVYKAYHKRLQKTVVIKKTHIRRMTESENRREADILKNLHHMYLPQVFDYIEEDSGLGDGKIGIYTVMDFINGRSFRTLLDEGRVFTQKQAKKYGTQLLEVLVYLHNQSIPILHGDIKPDNIILTPEDNICLIDFNISGVLTNGRAVSVGYTPGYAAPEQIAAVKAMQQIMSAGGQSECAAEIDRTHSRDYDVTKMCQDANEDKTELVQEQSDGTEQTEMIDSLVASSGDVSDEEGEIVLQNMPGINGIDVRADIYSAGAFIYHLVTGRKPDATATRVIPLSTWSNFSDGFAAVVDKAMEPDPDKRFQDSKAMLIALKNYEKSDRRYKALMIRQALLYALVLLGIVACVFVTMRGRKMMQNDTKAKYEELLYTMESARETGNEEEFMSLYEMALHMEPNRLNPCVERALMLYGQARFEEAIDYIEREVLSRNLPQDQDESLAQLYYIDGSSYYETREYGAAVECYENALKYNDTNAELYRDYAIVLAQMGDIKNASRVLEEAERNGVSSEQMALASAEIAAADGEEETAEIGFRRCIEQAEGDYIKMRAYVLYSDLLSSQGATEADLKECASLLEEAKTVLPQNQTALVAERLAKIYIRLYEETEEEQYGRKAAEVLEQIISRGWGSMTTINNLIVLYQGIGDIGQAEKYAEQMKVTFGESYETWKRMALLEISKQQYKDIDMREYRDFAEYFEKANELYDKQSGSQKTDAEMQILENAYEEIKQKGWIK